MHNLSLILPTGLMGPPGSKRPAPGGPMGPGVGGPPMMGGPPGGGPPSKSAKKKKKLADKILPQKVRELVPESQVSLFELPKVSLKFRRNWSIRVP